MGARRLGLLGGTFDPIHLGHLIVAETVREGLSLDEVWFIPCHVPPHKAGPATAAEDRLAMVELAVAEHPQFRVSRIELDRPGPSYAEDTLEAIRAAEPGAALFYIIGADMLREFDSWRHPERLVELAQFVAVTRPGERLDTRGSDVAARVQAFEMAPIGISSTLVRGRVRDGQSIRYLVPEPVRAYIARRGLYRAEQPARRNADRQCSADD